MLSMFLVVAICAAAGTGGISTANELQRMFRPLTPESGSLLLNDTLRPEISAWGIDGPAGQGLPFSVWANVTDSESGVRNVSVLVVGNTGYRSLHALDFNGSLYRAGIPGLAVNVTYSLNIIAFDMANNSATSYPRTVDLRETTSTTIDPSITAPIVISSSLALIVLISVVAVFYDRWHTRQNQS